MPAGHLISYLDLTLFGNINFGQTDNTCRQFITYGDVVLLALIQTINLLILNDIIMKKLLDLSFFFLSVVHLLGLTFKVINFLKHLKGELASLGDHINIQIILYTL
jgi:hypothetical protein